MKQSKILIPTLKQNPTGAEALSHKMLVRAGYIRQVSAGMYAYLPLAYRVLRNIKQIIRDELEKTSAFEMTMPDVIPAQMWKDSGRYDTYGPELFKFKNRHDTDFILGPTHEETFTKLIKDNIKSYKKLPLVLYQIQNKYRDEDRPRYGLLRSREFLMMDAYSFSANEESLDAIYREMETAFKNIFNKMGLRYQPIIADSGSMGGSDSIEFSAPAAVGEDTIVYSENGDYAANLEMATSKFETAETRESLNDLEEVKTPGVNNVKAECKFFDVPAAKIIKALVYMANKKPVMLLINGDSEVNEAKVKKQLNVSSLTLANAKQLKKYFDVKPGSIGPINVPKKIPVYADQHIQNVQNGITGANKDDTDFKNVNPDRDFKVTKYLDLINVKEGDLAPNGESKLKFTKGIEIGHIFKLGTRYSKSLGADILDENGRQKPVIMGSYGIGVSRLLSAISEQTADDNGLVWPKAIAPFDVHVIPTNVKDEKQQEMAATIETEMEKTGRSVLVDDRKLRAGVKFADSDLIGIPIRITIGKKASDGVVEIKLRKTGETVDANLNDLENTIDILSKQI